MAPVGNGDKNAAEARASWQASAPQDVPDIYPGIAETSRRRTSRPGYKSKSDRAPSRLPVPGIHAWPSKSAKKAWMAGTKGRLRPSSTGYARP